MDGSWSWRACSGGVNDRGGGACLRRERWGGTKPSSLAGVCVTVATVIAMPHSRRIWCRGGSPPLPFMLWDMLLAVASSSSSCEPRWGAWLAYLCLPLSHQPALAALCVNGSTKVRVRVCFCVCDWKSVMLAKNLAAARLILRLHFGLYRCGRCE